jgi:hypothetical protein
VSRSILPFACFTRSIVLVVHDARPVLVPIRPPAFVASSARAASRTRTGSCRALEPWRRYDRNRTKWAVSLRKRNEVQAMLSSPTG